MQGGSVEGVPRNRFRCEGPTLLTRRPYLLTIETSRAKLNFGTPGLRHQRQDGGGTYFTFLRECGLPCGQLSYRHSEAVGQDSGKKGVFCGYSALSGTSHGLLQQGLHLWSVPPGGSELLRRRRVDSPTSGCIQDPANWKSELFRKIVDVAQQLPHSQELQKEFGNIMFCGASFGIECMQAAINVHLSMNSTQTYSSSDYADAYCHA